MSTPVLSQESTFSLGAGTGWDKLRIEICYASWRIMELVAIEGFRHGGLKRFFERSDARRLHRAHVARIGRILSALDGSDPLAVLSAPGYRLHPLKGDRRGQWSVRVSDNWRIVFRVEGEHVFDVDLTDYH